MTAIEDRPIGFGRLKRKEDARFIRGKGCCTRRFSAARSRTRRSTRSTRRRRSRTRTSRR
jgi:hypothetical protein